ncbi:hypothetical protein [Acinetobacter baumannii]|uniref:hypothetical protein n=1 Tax=Acinetobacter baumannii TaxID=470 RepID=UPI00148EB007|nr:hypothetical protein [Acinetobacter baumannii]MDC5104531.1 hypothetical protein [Acinetobacter baumannii]
MAEILITRIPNSRDADKVGIELESILDALAAKSTGPYTATVEITNVMCAEKTGGLPH